LTATQSRLPRPGWLLADGSAGGRRRGARFGVSRASGAHEACGAASALPAVRLPAEHTPKATSVGATGLWVAV